MSEKGNSEISLLVIVVLYKNEINSAETIKSLIQCKDYFNHNLRIAVWDNSPQAQNEEKVQLLEKQFENFYYYHTGKNLSLAKVYNRLIKEHENFVDFVNIWDQDSTFSIDFYEKFELAIQENSICLYLPKVYQEKQLVSPGLFKVYRGQYLSRISTGINKSEGIIGIGSGIIVKVDVFNDILFDEDLQLYGIDTCFFMDYWKRYEHLYVMDYDLKHRMSAFEEESFEKKAFRFLDWKRSMLIIAKRTNFLARGLIYLYVIGISVKSAIQFKNLSLVLKS